MDKILHASNAGFPCLRNLFYSVNGFEGITSPKSQRIFDVGTALEPCVVQWLRNDGWKVEYNQGSQDAPLEVSVLVKGGYIKGHPDAFMSRPDGLQNVLVDIKTMNDRAFTQWKREGTLASKPQYVTQLHCYAMGAMNLSRPVEHLAIAGINKNNSELHIDVFHFDELLADIIIDRANILFSLNSPEEAEQYEPCPAENWACNYCEFSHLCKARQEHHTEQAATDTQATDAEEIINAVNDLANARAISKHAKELEDGAKAVLDGYMKQNGISSLKAGGYICSIKERNTTRFDTNAFKKVHPDLAGQFSVKSSYTTYELKETGA